MLSRLFKSIHNFLVAKLEELSPLEQEILDILSDGKERFGWDILKELNAKRRKKLWIANTYVPLDKLSRLGRITGRIVEGPDGVRRQLYKILDAEAQP